MSPRLIGQRLSDNVGQQVVVDNRVGGIIVSDIGAKAPPDGYTLLLYADALWRTRHVPLGLRETGLAAPASVL